MPESDDNLRLQIGHVLFIDIVGYSKLLIEEQKERLNQLTEIVLATATVRAATARDSRSRRRSGSPHRRRPLPAISTALPIPSAEQPSG